MKMIKGLFCFMLATGMSVSLFAQDTWIQKSNFGGGARYAGVGISIGDKGYIGLGVDESGYKIDFWEYDPAADTWTQKENFPGGFRYAPTGFTIGNKGYVGTGAYTPGDVDWVWYNDLWEYDPATNDWTQKASFDGLGRNGAVGFSIGNKGYIGTGQYRFNRYYNSQYLQDVFEYDPLTNTWQKKADMPEQGRYAATGISIGDKGYVGLGVYYYDTRLKDWWQFDPVANTWTPKKEFEGTQRYQASGFTIGDKGYVGIGVYYAQLNDFWEYNPSTNTWSRKADYPDYVYGASAFQIGCKGYIGTGGDNSGGLVSSFYEYSPNTNSLNVEIPDTYAVNPGGDPNTIYLGYGPSSLTLTAQVTGGIPYPDSTYRYLWNDSSTSRLLSVSPEVVGSHTYTVLVSDKIGCTATGEKTIIVQDVRCGAKMDKVQVCMVPPGNNNHTNTTCLNPEAVSHLLSLGSYLGACSEANAAPRCFSKISVYPNPNSGLFNVQVSNVKSIIEINVIDRNGKVVAKHLVDKTSDLQAENIDLGSVPGGIYFIRIKSKDGIVMQKILVHDK